MYRLFGYHEYWYRLFWWVIALLGSYSFFRCCFEVSGHYLESLIGGLILFSFPLMAYYSINFISDPVAVYFSCISLLPFVRYLKTCEKNHLIYFSLLILFSGLMKISAIVVPVAALVVCLYYVLYTQRKFSSVLPVLSAFIFTLSGLFM